MPGFVMRASHFFSHPFGLHLFGATSPACADSRRTSRLPGSTHSHPHPHPEADLSWMSLSLTGQEVENPRTDLCWLSLEPEEPVVTTTHNEDLTWMGLEEVEHPEEFE
jgi:hypothetical protein